MILEQKVLLTPKECQDIIISCDIWNQSLLGSSTGEEYKPKLRKSFVHIKKPRKGEALYEYIQRGLSLVSEELIAEGPFNLQILRYEEGGFIYKHKDDVTANLNGVVFSKYYMIILLNEDFEGGDFIAYNKNDEKIILTKQVGNVLIGDPNMFHEVTEVTKGTRYSLICFITPDLLKAKNTII
jgi:PKHD-type hydroxylase